MEKPFYLITSTSGNSGYLFDRRVISDVETLPMRERLIKSGCTVKEISSSECEDLLKNDKGWHIF